MGGSGWQWVAAPLGVGAVGGSSSRSRGSQTNQLDQSTALSSLFIITELLQLLHFAHISEGNIHVSLRRFFLQGSLNHGFQMQGKV